MKVGIITFHNAHNYGAVLQAYALKKTTEKFGCNCQIINYKLDNIEKMYDVKKQLFSFPKNIKSIVWKFFWLVYFKRFLRRQERFNSFINDYLVKETDQYTDHLQLEATIDDFDIFICGSDQIWSPNAHNFDSAYFLSFVKSRKRTIAYAPSFGVNKISDDLIDEVKRRLTYIDYISVRENQGAEIIKSITGKKVEVVLDPTLLLSIKDWKKLSRIPKYKKSYILLYTVQDVLEIKKFALDVSTKMNIPIIRIGYSPRDFFYSFKKKYDAGPREFLGLIENAKIVCTDSFHGTIFSIIFQKSFFAALNQSANENLSVNSRLTSLLEKINLESRLIDGDTEFSVDSLGINYEKVNLAIAKEITRSVTFLKKSMS